MDSVRLEWHADHDTYQLHVPGQPNIVCTIGDLEEIKACIEAFQAKF